MKICICDDNAVFHREIKDKISAFMETEILDFFRGEDLLEYCKCAKTPIDIIFLDIEMDSLNGINTAKEIRKINNKVIIIFVSSYSEYVFEAFDVNALHFIQKPVDDEKFKDVFTRAIQKYNSQNTAITLKWQSERYIIMIDEIIFVEGYNRHLMVHTINGDYEVKGKIDEIFPQLESHGFLKVHQGYIVNLAYISQIKNDEIVMRDKSKIYMSVRRKISTVKAYDEYVKKMRW